MGRSASSRKRGLGNRGRRGGTTYSSPSCLAQPSPGSSLAAPQPALAALSRQTSASPDTFSSVNLNLVMAKNRGSSCTCNSCSVTVSSGCSPCALSYPARPSLSARRTSCAEETVFGADKLCHPGRQLFPLYRRLPATQSLNRTVENREAGWTVRRCKSAAHLALCALQPR